VIFDFKQKTSAMKKLNRIVCKLCGLLMFCTPAMAVEMPELARRNDCVNCHAINERVVGPAWIDVAKKYAGDPMAEEKLLVRVSKGSSGFFGLIHMPANDPDGRKQAEMRELVRFILALARS